MSNWNHPAQFQYDSADLPFLPPSSAESGSLESSTPFWKVNSITDVEKSFTSPEYFAYKPLFRSPLMKLLDANSRSHENVNTDFGCDLPLLSASAPAHITDEQRRRLSQSLPATPLTTPGQTPLTTPNPTPQSSPSLHRKAEMDAVSKAAIRCSNRLLQSQSHQQHDNAVPQNKWFYLGFLPHSNSGGGTAGCPRSPLANDSIDAAGTLEKNVAGNVTVADNKPATSDSADLSGKLVGVNDTRQLQSDFGSRNCRRKCGFLMTNRDMNFLAPTSM